MIDLRQVQAFVAVVDQQSFTKAAERLNIGQSGLSSQVKKLERQLGFSLFDRSGRSVTPTDEGVALYQSAQLLLAAAENFERTAGSATTTPLLRLAIAENGVNALAVDLLGRLRESFPDTDLELQRVSLDDQHLNVGVEFDGVIARPPFASDLASEVGELLLAEDPLVLVVHESHPYAQRDCVSVADLGAIERLALHWIPDSWVAEFPVLASATTDERDGSVASFRDAMVSVSISRTSCVMPASFAATYNLTDVETVPITDTAPMRVVLLSASTDPDSLAGRLLEALGDRQPVQLPIAAIA